MSHDPTRPSAAPELHDTEVEDTTTSRVADVAANEAADALIDQAEADPVRPGEPVDAHRDER